jgi:hypothetical protein
MLRMMLRPNRTLNCKSVERGSYVRQNSYMLPSMLMSFIARLIIGQDRNQAYAITRIEDYQWNNNLLASANAIS